MNPTNNKKNDRSAWLVLLGCCLMQGGSMGIVQNSMGVFFQAISSDLGVSLGGISFYRTINALASCLLLPFVGKILYKADTRITLTISALLYGGSTMLMSTFTRLEQWYGASVVLGLASAMLIMASAPIILANWFTDKLGFAVGLSASFSGLMGMVGNMGAGKIATELGWRAAYVAVGGCSLLLLLPATLFLIHLQPEGCREVRKSEPKYHLTARQWIPAGIIAAMVTTVVLCTGFSPEIVPFSVSLGKTVSYGTFLVSLTMLSNAFGKILLGRINDRHGLVACGVIGAVIAAASFLFLFSSRELWLNVGGVLYGIGMALALVTPPLLVRKFYAQQVYPQVYSMVMMLFTMFSSVGPGLFGAMYDHSGSFQGVLWLCIALSLAYLALGGVLQQMLRRKNYVKEIGTS